jgi:hypothetical protein
MSAKWKRPAHEECLADTGEDAMWTKSIEATSVVVMVRRDHLDRLLEDVLVLRQNKAAVSAENERLHEALKLCGVALSRSDVAVGLELLPWHDSYAGSVEQRVVQSALAAIKAARAALSALATKEKP